MVFLYTAPQQVSYWMKNTFIPLDMIFIRPDHTIAKVETAIPLNLAKVSADRMLLEQVLLNLTRNGIEAMQHVAPERRLLLRTDPDLPAPDPT